MAMKNGGAAEADLMAAGAAFCALNDFPADEMADILYWAAGR